MGWKRTLTVLPVLAYAVPYVPSQRNAATSGGMPPDDLPYATASALFAVADAIAAGEIEPPVRGQNVGALVARSLRILGAIDGDGRSLDVGWRVLRNSGRAGIAKLLRGTYPDLVRAATEVTAGRSGDVEAVLDEFEAAAWAARPHGRTSAVKDLEQRFRTLVRHALEAGWHELGETGPFHAIALDRRSGRTFPRLNRAGARTPELRPFGDDTIREHATWVAVLGEHLPSQWPEWLGMTPAEVLSRLRELEGR